MNIKRVGETQDWQGSFIRFELFSSDQKKTKKWMIWSASLNVIGVIKWFGRWRKYCFFPEPETAFEEVCLGEISEFIQMMTQKHKRKEV
jgi:hypothetical protein